MLTMMPVLILYKEDTAFLPWLRHTQILGQEWSKTLFHQARHRRFFFSRTDRTMGRFPHQASSSKCWLPTFSLPGTVKMVHKKQITQFRSWNNDRNATICRQYTLERHRFLLLTATACCIMSHYYCCGNSNRKHWQPPVFFCCWRKHAVLQETLHIFKKNQQHSGYSKIQHKSKRFTTFKEDLAHSLGRWNRFYANEQEKNSVD